MKRLIGILAVTCFFSSPLVSQTWDKYPMYEEYLSTIEEFQANYPELCKIYEIGESVQGRKLLVAKISDNVETDEKEPGFLCHAAMHGDELLGYMLMQRLIDSLLAGYGTDPLCTKLVDNIEIYIAPLVNPDGAYYGGNGTVTKARRVNANGVDLLPEL